MHAPHRNLQPADDLDGRARSLLRHQGRPADHAESTGVSPPLPAARAAGFVKIRHYGLWAAGRAQQKLEQAQKLLAEPEQRAPGIQPALVEAEESDEETKSLAEDSEEPEDFAQKLLRLCGVDVTLCPKCQQGRLVRKPLPEGPQAAQPHGADTS